MKIRSLVSISILVSGLLAGFGPASADQKRTFSFVGEVDSFDRSNHMLVVDDHVFRVSDSARVHKKKTQKATLSEIRPGVKIGFYPAQRDGRRQESSINAIWVLPADWKGTHGYADDFED